MRFQFDPENASRLTPEEAERLDLMTDEEITAAAESDPDNPPLTDEELARMRPVVDVRRLRERLGLSQVDFASRFHVPVRRLRQWEARRSEPDEIARVLLRVIERDPAAVERALVS